jgi:REP element-mobilizing transposase RayT
LRDDRIAQRVVSALRFFDGTRYQLHAWCVMPNHVHVVFTIASNEEKSRQDAGATGRSPLATILHSWKSHVAKEANKILGRGGPFWQREYYDHLIRDEADFYQHLDYTILNPVKAGLCKEWREWPWSGLGSAEANDDGEHPA